MIELPDGLFWMVPLSLGAAGAGLSILGNIVPVRLARGLCGLSLVPSVAWIVYALTRLLTAAGFSWSDQGRARPAFLFSPGPVDLWIDVSGLLLLSMVCVGAAVLIVSGATAWGSGPRREHASLSSGQLGGQLLGLSLVIVALTARRLDITLGCATLASVVGCALLGTSRGKLSGLESIVRLFVVHRLIDVVLMAGGLLLMFAHGTSDIRDMLGGILKVTAQHTVAQGPLAGHSVVEMQTLGGGLLLLGLVLRTGGLLVGAFFRNGGPAPLPAVSFVHGVLFIAPAWGLALRFAPLWLVSARSYQPFILLLSAGALVWVLSAVFVTDAVRVEVRSAYAVAQLGMLAALTVDIEALELGAAMLFLAGPALVLPTCAAIEAMQGQTNLFSLGGLWRSLSKSDRTRALATAAFSAAPFSLGFFFYERLLRRSFTLTTPSTYWAMSAAGWGCAIALSFVAFRSLHMTFAGDAPRGHRPAVLVEVDAVRWGPPLLLALSVVLGATLVALPNVLARRILPDYDELLERMLRATFGSAPPVDDGVRLSVMAGLVVATGVVFVLSRHWFGASFRVPPAARRWFRAEVPVARAFARWVYLEVIMRRAVVVPLGEGLRFIARVIPIASDVVMTRLPVPALALGQALLRLFHNGDVQRGLALTLLALAFLLKVWWTH